MTKSRVRSLASALAGASLIAALAASAWAIASHSRHWEDVVGTVPPLIYSTAGMAITLRERQARLQRSMLALCATMLLINAFLWLIPLGPVLFPAALLLLAAAFIPFAGKVGIEGPGVEPEVRDARPTRRTVLWFAALVVAILTPIGLVAGGILFLVGAIFPGDGLARRTNEIPAQLPPRNGRSMVFWVGVGSLLGLSTSGTFGVLLFIAIPLVVYGFLRLKYGMWVGGLVALTGFGWIYLSSHSSTVPIILMQYLGVSVIAGLFGTLLTAMWKRVR